MAIEASARLENPICAICIEEIQPDATVTKLNCAHQYHKDCLQPWLDANHDTCPLDRGKITSINGVSLDRPEREETVHEVVVENLSIHSAAAFERFAARIQAALREEETVHEVVVANSLAETRALNPRSIRVIRSPSIHSEGPVECLAAKTLAVFFSMFR